GFKMVYDFESVAYNTPVGEVSMPFRTQFGYHVLKVNDKRPSKGYVSAAHIMVANNQKDNTVNPEDRINEIYKLLKEGQSFESLAKQYSDDRSTSNNGGKLKEFKSSQLGSVEFEDKVFALESSGDVSKPFKTAYGWHIAKLINKRAIGTFEENQSRLEGQVKRDPRSKRIDETFYENLKKQYNIPKSFDLSYFETILDDRIYKREWSVPVDLDQNRILFDFGDKKLTYHDFALYMESSQKQMAKGQDYKSFISDLFKNYFKKRLMAYHESKLEYINPEYASVLSEYRDGLLLFDLMQEKIWNAVKEDSLGLQKYYQEHKGNYIWPNRVDADVFSCTEKDKIKEAIQHLKERKDIENIKEDLNSNDKQTLMITSGLFTNDHRALPEGFEFKVGISKIYMEDNVYKVVNVRDILEVSIKTFEEAKGKVISDYQNVVEQNWVEQLKQKYPISINKKILKRVKKAIVK
ncbi:MAG: peptidylprolyl isomerase, partial [Bacteroidia bacterium]|nr:peptidylprolyl isomerase [Bacteroidia bacterium]